MALFKRNGFGHVEVKTEEIQVCYFEGNEEYFQIQGFRASCLNSSHDEPDIPYPMWKNQSLFLSDKERVC